jgi:hypothetical protein
VSKRPTREDSGTNEEATGEAAEADTGEVKIKVRKA